VTTVEAAIVRNGAATAFDRARFVVDAGKGGAILRRKLVW